MVKKGDTVASVASLLVSKNSKEVGWDNWKLGLVGISNDGKTTLASTASEDESGQCGDMQWILVDNDGLLGFQKQGKSVDYFDLTVVPSARIVAAAKEALDATAELMREGKKKTVVFDSLSTFAALIQANVKSLYPGDKFGMWDEVLYQQMQVFDKVRSLPGNVICIVHLKAENMMKAKDADVNKVSEAKMKAKGLNVGDLRMDISGKAYEYYQNNLSEIWAVRSKGKAPNREFNVYPYGIGGIKCKTKQNCFDACEPADLQVLFKKIRGQ